MPMNFIPCTDPCIYQKDGYCTLSRAGSGGNPSAHKGCVHFLPHAASQENQGNYQNAIGDRSSNQHPYKEKFSRQTKTENTAHHGQALSVYLPTNWNHRRICTKKQTQGEMIPLESISKYVSDSDFGRTNTRISKIRWCSTRVTVTSSVS